VNAQTTRQWLEECERVIAQQSNYLTQLDAAIGDADHGSNMSRGFAAVRQGLHTQPPNLSPGTLLVNAGNQFMISVGGASGSLWGSALRRAGSVMGEVDKVDTRLLTQALQASLEAVVELGAAQPGDKTMVDALGPAVSALQQAVEGHLPLKQALGLACAAAEQGMRDTIPLVARKGRASYLGERSVGHQDPGATSTVLVLQSLLAVIDA
jgi:dihydroxyacetone kinase-like protein